MSYWSWDESLSVGIEFIDVQHRRIIDYINALDEAKQDSDVSKISQVLTGLVDYTRTHFVWEEDIMRQVGYPLIDSHKDVHDAFTRNIDKHIKLHEGGKDITRKLLSDLRVWLTAHIKRDDKDFAPYAAKYKKDQWKRKFASRFVD